jgi:HAD superfamily hydrolase (TIGR01509 family)
MNCSTEPWRFQGRVVTGLGQGAGFTALPWARHQFKAGLGFAPFPGTLNLGLDRPADRLTWALVRGAGGIRIRPTVAGACAARCFPVVVSVPGRAGVTSALVLPEVPAYPSEQVEVIAPIGLRDQLGLPDGALVTVRSAVAPRLQAVLFDVDGTLVNSIAGYQLAAQRAAEPFGFEVTTRAVSRALNFGEPFWPLVIPEERHGDEVLISRLREATLRHWPAVLEESVPVFPGIPALLEQLRDRGLRLGICTASSGESFQPLERAGLLGLFDVVVTANDVERRKPDPEGILLCMQRMGLQAADVAYVGDTVADIQASHAAGLYSVGVLTGAGDASLLAAAGAHRLAADPGQLAGFLLGG